MNRKKLLLLNGSHAEIPMIVEAKKFGWHVTTTGNDRVGIGHPYADENIFGDYSDCEFVYDLAKSLRVDAIISSCNDFAYISTAYACEKLNLRGHDSYENACIIHNKKNFRDVMKILDLPTPKFLVCNLVDELPVACEKIKFPLIVKPTDLTGGKGVSVCKNLSELETAFKTAQKVTRKTSILLEEFIDGSNHAANFFIQDQKVLRAFFDDEQYYRNKYLVSGASSPSSLRQFTMAEVILYVEKIAKYLKLVDGIFHVQFMVTSDGTPILIDPCRRAPGDLYVRLVEHSSGFNCAKEIILSESGLKVEIGNQLTHRFIARECIMANRCGIIDDIFIDSKLENKIICKMIWAKSGDEVENFLTYKAGILFLEFDNFSDMNNTLKNFNNLVRIDFK
ncbi:MAG: ATP-grasp domain-containing protein [Selenomonadaceae bacterium]|nr:ATP-grasp domain-containing protein [Selenomonadaceae bacterium]